MTVTNCVGNAKVWVRSSNGNHLDYEMINCKYDSNSIWNCPCGGKTSFKIIVDNNVNREFDFKIEYYSSATKTHQYKRQHEINNLRFSPMPREKAKFNIATPKLSEVGVIILVVAIILIILVSIFQKRKHLKK